MTDKAWGISAHNQYFWWSKEGKRLVIYGIKGDHYELVDGKPAYTDKVLKLSPLVPALGLTQKQTEVIQSKWPVISTYIQEQIQKWTFDGSNIDSEFDKYMSDIKGMGIEEVLATYQAAYEIAS